MSGAKNLTFDVAFNSSNVCMWNPKVKMVKYMCQTTPNLCIA